MKLQVPDSIHDVKRKVKVLADWLLQFKGSCVVHVGAGLSTSAGIRDFRGKRGVWTEHLSRQTAKQERETPSSASTDCIKKEQDATTEPAPARDKVEVKPFDETEPTFGHRALKALCQLGHVSHIVSQNVDGLFLKANLERSFISELHGNFYLDECTRCRSRFIRGTASVSMRLQRSNVKCPRNADCSNSCKGYLRDTILDWESPIPFQELRVATRESKRNRLHICIGTSLQLKPSMDLVCKQTKQTGPTPMNSNKLVIINLQPTQFDSKADLVIHYYADDVMRELVCLLDIEVPDYEREEDPTKDINLIGKAWKK